MPSKRGRAVYRAVRGNVGGVDADTIHEACAIAWLALVRRDDVELDGRGFAWLVITATRETWRAYRAGIESTDPSAVAAAEIELLRDPFAHDHDPLERALDAELHAARRERFAALKPRERRDMLLKAAGYKYPEIDQLSRGVCVNVAVLADSDVGDMSPMGGARRVSSRRSHASRLPLMPRCDSAAARQRSWCLRCS